MEYGRAWNPIYATIHNFRIFGIVTRKFDIGAGHHVLIPTENATKNVTVWSKSFCKFSATVNNHITLLQN